MNKKGFTLVELMAVIIVLIILSLFSFFAVSKIVERNHQNAFIKEAKTIAKAAQNKYFNDKNLEYKNRDDLYNGTIDGRVCYSIRDNLLGKYVQKDTKNGYSGSVEVCYGSDCTYDYKLWFFDGDSFYIDGKSVINNRDDIDYSRSTEYFNSCGHYSFGSHGGINNSADFDFVNGEEQITVLQTGIYALEAWGAQGGDYSGYVYGGYGAYAYTEVELRAGQVLFINVGGKGQDGVCKKDDNTCKTSYNGGAKGGKYIAGGGGSTSISTMSGKIYNLPLDYVYLIAGGGAGSTSEFTTISRRHGGGYCNNRGECGRFGVYGGLDNSHTVYRGSGGGYSVFTAWSYGYGSDAPNTQGGTSYVSNPRTRNGLMSCYNCSEGSKTIINPKVSSDAVTQESKKGNGYARISLLGDYSINYVLNGGTLSTPNKTVYNKGDITFTLNNPSKPYYEFIGWTFNNSSEKQMTVTIPSGSTGNRKYTANFTPIIYNITYNLNGGELPSGKTNPTTFNVESGSITLNNPVKDGYKFVGWTLNDETTPVATVSIPTGSHDDRTYTANYVKTYDVTYDYNISSYEFPTGGIVLDTGFVPNWDYDMKFEVIHNFPTAGKRYLVIGNYEKSSHYNMEINTSNKIRNYQGGDRGTSSAAIVFGEDITFTFVYNPFGKAFTTTAVGAETNASASGTFIYANGASNGGLRLGQDYRGGSTFGVTTLKGLKLTKAYMVGSTLSDLPSNVSKSDATFVGWFTDPTGGNEITSSTVVGTTPVTYYAHWESN